ncbi:host-nuclease inhibitor Gam family protein [Sphingomonas hengshuiensis]|uniref:Host-nuclease inhibitor protein Gam n=1 Tax=Sphingomonas hengshuiensis TaxID=1609977 RepID=A0A7U4LFW4_9SPHN|nr:host-nuclease inhibitor Gam family protein [Sphingomonas hengshuiensis]AJP72939.1 hypothetical protein TS85_15785 [Sphingomonas hengshuiensis]
MTATDTPALQAPTSIEEAAALLERYAVLAGAMTTIAERRTKILARANAAADGAATPLIDEMAAIAALIEPWWKANAAALTEGKRKSIELGGCMIGSKLGASSLISAKASFDQQAEAMRKLEWGKPYVRVTVSIDKAAVRKGLAGPDAAKLKRRGFSVAAGADEFFLERVAQDGARPAAKR